MNTLTEFSPFKIPRHGLKFLQVGASHSQGPGGFFVPDGAFIWRG